MDSARKPRLQEDRAHPASLSSPDHGRDGPGGTGQPAGDHLDSGAGNPPASEDNPPAPHGKQPAMVTVPLWMRRLSLFIFVAFCIELGMLLVVLPWTRLWSDNNLILNYPALRSFLQQSFVRGAVSGVGLVDIYLGIWEAWHYKETPRP